MLRHCHHAHLCPRGFGWTMSHMISSSRKPGWSAMIGLYMALRYEMLCTPTGTH